MQSQPAIRPFPTEYARLATFAVTSQDDLPALQKWLRDVPKFNVGVIRGSPLMPIIDLGMDAGRTYWKSAGEIICDTPDLKALAILLVGAEIARRNSEMEDAP